VLLLAAVVAAGAALALASNMHSPIMRAAAQNADRLGDQYYAVMVDSLDKQAAGDPALRKLLADGVGRLDSARGIAWVQLSNGARDAVLKSMEGSEFFATIRAATINNLYTNPLVYRFFGFEGSSVEHGGYIRRGFDDIGWLPSS